jgi:hypothetical protein
MIVYVFGKCDVMVVDVKQTERAFSWHVSQRFIRGDIEKTDRPHSGRVWSTLRAYHAPCTRVNIRHIYLFIMRIKERARKGEKEERNAGREKERNVSARMMHTCIRAHEFDSPALKMHAIPFHTHIIKSPKSREIAPRRACPRSRPPIHPTSYRIPIPPFSLRS